MSRGLTNCNPGNIRRSGVRYKGEVVPSRDPDFRQFKSLEWGYRAIFMLLHTYRVRYGLNTAAGMIARWAPPSENHTQVYVRFVAQAVGIGENDPVDTFDPAVMVPFAAAISEVENGVKAERSPIEAGWWLFAAEYKL